MADEKMGEDSGKDKMYCKMCGYGRGHFVLRIILGLVIVFVAFCLGIMVGHFGGGHRNFGGYSKRGYMQRYPSPMMRAYPGGGYPGTMMQGAPGSMMPQSATSTPVKK